MKIYDTLSRSIQDFKPIIPGVAKLYTCGPTVYDYSHLGNLRAYVFDDTLRRALSSSGLEVQHVMNITDVGHLASDEDEGEDKLEKGAGRENKTVWEVAEFYIKAFKEDTNKLNILPPNAYHGPDGVYARATDFIDVQIKIIDILIKKGFAYQTNQAIYFDVSKLSDYGKLTGQNLADKEVAARPEVVTDADKKNAQDFALWFFTIGRFASHSMHWPSQWGEGFPGWHLECSAIIHSTLGEPIDIHTGGVDHIGTHHTNEIAQSEAAFGAKLSNFWVHNEHLLVEGQKMSKSLGNFHTLSDVIKQGFNPLALRILFLQSHYRTQASFSWLSLEAAANFLKSLESWADLRFQRLPKYPPEAISGLQEAFYNDLNTPEALSRLSKLINDPSSAPDVKILSQIDQLFGISLSERSDIDSADKQIISNRETARLEKNWQAADELRNTLANKGIELMDSADGPIWTKLS